MLANIPDYSSANVCYNEYQFDESELAELDSSPPDPVPQDTTKVPDQDYWGTISDELFDSVPLNEIEQTAKTSECAASKPPQSISINQSHNVKKSAVKTKRIQYDTDSEDDQDKSILDERSFSSATESRDETSEDNAPKKRALPSWLTQPTAKEEIKKRVKNNSLFKI